MGKVIRNRLTKGERNALEIREKQRRLDSDYYSKLPNRVEVDKILFERKLKKELFGDYDDET